jgi:plasmid stabilization system protein ParE
MRIRWTENARHDLVRLESFLSPVNELAAARAVQMLVAAPDRLLGMPRIGERVEEIPDREVRRMLAAPYELLYEILPNEIAILRVFHTREDR